jgi:hypothetical protein
MLIKYSRSEISNNNIFYPFELNFHTYFNTYFFVSVSSSFYFRTFQPRFYEYIKFGLTSLDNGFRKSKDFSVFSSFRVPSNSFSPSFFVKKFAFEEILTSKFFNLGELFFKFFYSFKFKILLSQSYIEKSLSCYNFYPFTSLKFNEFPGPEFLRSNFNKVSLVTSVYNHEDLQYGATSFKISRTIQRYLSFFLPMSLKISSISFNSSFFKFSDKLNPAKFTAFTSPIFLKNFFVFSFFSNCFKNFYFIPFSFYRIESDYNFAFIKENILQDLRIDEFEKKNFIRKKKYMKLQRFVYYKFKKSNFANYSRINFIPGHFKFSLFLQSFKFLKFIN